MNNFGRAPDSCHRDDSKSSRELFEKVRVNAPFFWYFGFRVGFSAISFGECALIPVFGTVGCCFAPPSGR